jgi:amino acid transporter
VAVAPSQGRREVTSLRRRISFADLIVYGLVFIGPAAAVSIFGPLDAESHGVVPVVYLVATLAMSFTAFSYAQMSRQVPRAGSVFAYASAGIGPRTGFLTGWMVMLDYLLIPSVAYLFTGIAMHSFLPAIPTWGWTAMAVVFTTGFNLAGVRVAARVAALTVVAEVVVLGMVLVGGVWLLAHDGPTRDWLSPFTGVGGFSIAAVLGAVSVAVLSYLGFDAIATFAEETTGSSRLVGRATLTCLVIAGLLFAAQTYVGSVISPVTPQELAADPASQGEAYYHLVDVQLAGWLSTLLALSKAAGAAFSAMVGQAAASRILMDMGRERRLPRAMSKVDERTGVPAVGVLVAAVFNVVIAIWAARQPDGLDTLVSVVSVGALCAFILLHSSVVGYFWVRRLGDERHVGKHVVAPLVGAAILVVVLIEASSRAQVVGAVWLAVGVAVAVIQHRRGRTTDPVSAA